MPKSMKGPIRLTEPVPGSPLMFRPEPSDSDEQSSNQKEPLVPWDLLIVDDDDSVLSVTKLALRKFMVDGRPMNIHTAEAAINRHSCKPTALSQ